jgi:excisionase family DNA binding protein
LVVDRCDWWTVGIIAVPELQAAPSRTATDIDDDAPLTTVEDAAERLGVTKSTIRRWGYKRKLRIIKLSPKVSRIPLADIKALIATGLFPKTK